LKRRIKLPAEQPLKRQGKSMAHPWEAEQTIEPPKALHLIQESFPELQVKNIRLLGVGWDNTAFIVDEDERIYA
jgi:hypothetical protein